MTTGYITTVHINSAGDTHHHPRSNTETLPPSLLVNFKLEDSNVILGLVKSSKTHPLKIVKKEGETVNVKLHKKEVGYIM